MTIADAIKGSGLANIDAEVLLAHALGKNRAWLVAHSNESVAHDVSCALQEYVKRREKGEPVAYIIGSQEFYGRNFLVTSDVLIPRPSTEALIDATLDFLKLPRNEERKADTSISIVSRVLQDIKPEAIVDIGTGSGCIAITLACEQVHQKIIGVDLSEKATKVAQKNAKVLCPERNIEFIVADGIQFVAEMKKPFLLVSNPPYIPIGTELQKSVAEFEPKEALFAGVDGLNVIRPLLNAANKKPACMGMILECRSDQVSAIMST